MKMEGPFTCQKRLIPMLGFHRNPNAKQPLHIYQIISSRRNWFKVPLCFHPHNSYNASVKIKSHICKNQISQKSNIHTCGILINRVLKKTHVIRIQINYKISAPRLWTCLRCHPGFLGPSYSKSIQTQRRAFITHLQPHPSQHQQIYFKTVTLGSQALTLARPNPPLFPISPRIRSHTSSFKILFLQKQCGCCADETSPPHLLPSPHTTPLVFLRPTKLVFPQGLPIHCCHCLEHNDMALWFTAQHAGLCSNVPFSEKPSLITISKPAPPLPFLPPPPLFIASLLLEIIFHVTEKPE